MLIRNGKTNASSWDNSHEILMNTKYIDKLPRIVIVTSNDMQTNAVAAYNAVKKELYINEKMGIKTELLKLQKDCAVPDNVLSTTLHELLHWEDAQKYIDKFGLIDTKDKYLKYYDYFNEISKEYIEKHYKKRI